MKVVLCVCFLGQLKEEKKTESFQKVFLVF